MLSKQSCFTAAFILFTVKVNILFGEKFSKLSKIDATTSIWNFTTEKSNPKRSEIFCEKFRNYGVNCTGEGDLKGINNFFSKQTGRKPTDLHLSNCRFPNGVMERNLITIAKVELLTLEINECYLTSFKKGAFQGAVMNSLETLILIGINVATFSRYTFDGLFHLNSLQIFNTDENCDAVQLMEPLASLKTFSYHASKGKSRKPIDIHSFLRRSYENLIENVHLENINIGKGLLVDNDAFKLFESLTSLKLINCQIQGINRKSFASLNKTLELLSLKQNNLHNIPSDTFAIFLQKPKITIDLTENKWECNCNLRHLIKDFTKFPDKFQSKTLCYGPPRVKNKLITDEIVCSHLKCNFCENCIPRYEEYLELNEPSIYFNVLSIAATKCKIQFNEEISDFGVIWFKNKKHDNARTKISGCAIGNENSDTIVIDDLTPNKTYIFCLIKHGATVVSPLNCQSYYAPTFLHFRKGEEGECQTPGYIYAAISVGLLLCAILGALAVYFAMWSPNLFRDSKKVIPTKNNLKKSAAVGDISVYAIEESMNNSYSEQVKLRVRSFSESNMYNTRCTSYFYEAIMYPSTRATNKEIPWSNHLILDSISPPHLPPFTRRYLKILEKNGFENDCAFYSL